MLRKSIYGIVLCSMLLVVERVHAQAHGPPFGEPTSKPTSRPLKKVKPPDPEISDEELAKLAIRGNVIYRPGWLTLNRLVKEFGSRQSKFRRLESSVPIGPAVIGRKSNQDFTPINVPMNVGPQDDFTGGGAIKVPGKNLTLKGTITADASLVPASDVSVNVESEETEGVGFSSVWGFQLCLFLACPLWFG